MTHALLLAHVRVRAHSSALAEDAPQPRAQTLGAALPHGGCVRVGVVINPDVVVDGRWDLDRDMRHCYLYIMYDSTHQ